MSARNLGAHVIVHAQPYNGPFTIDPRSGDRHPRFSEATRGGPEQTALDGKRILLVEDEFFVAMLVQDLLQQLGLVVVGPVPDLAHGLELAQREPFDAAVLDVNLAGETSYEIADELSRRGIPFLFATGYSTSALPEQYRTAPCLPKPVELSQLRRQLRMLLA